jgi:hypothetical protein
MAQGYLTGNRGRASSRETTMLRPSRGTLRISVGSNTPEGEGSLIYAFFNGKSVLIGRENIAMDSQTSIWNL